jgi:hypothetical protein
MEEAAPPNYGKYLPFNKALHLRRYESSAALIFQPKPPMCYNSIAPFAEIELENMLVTNDHISHTYCITAVAGLFLFQ